MRSTAIVVGASVAGLAAARVLSDHFESVIVLERDELPDTNAPRRGVPQGPHSHVLVAAGLREFERLLPGFQADLVSAGGTAIDIGSELYLSRYHRAWPRVPSGIEFMSISRPMLELILRDRVVKLPGVAIRAGAAVTALTGASDAVTGVELATGEHIAAELVVDCTGRAGRSDRWMADLGLPEPEQVDVKIGLGYATRLFRRGPDDLPGWKGIVTLPEPPRETTVGVAFPIEDDRWLVSLIGWHVDALPDEDESFAAAVAALPDPAIADLLGRVEPLTHPVTARLRSNHRRLFERLDRVPAGYVALGDAVCSFNPFYGHGMTCAVQEAVALGTALERHGRASVGMVRDYYQAAAAVVATPWQVAVDGDFAYPETTGPCPRGVGARNWLATRLMLASQVIPELKTTFFGVLQLVLPPDRLMRPKVVMQALLHGRHPAGRNPLTSFVRQQSSRHWLKTLGLASAPMDRFVGRVSHGRITMLGLVGLPSLMLTTTGRRSGLSRCQPLLYTQDGDGYVVAGTNWGHPAHPGWSANLLAEPAAIVEVRGRRIPVRAALAEGPERERLWRVITAGWPAYQTYAAATERSIRVFRLVPQTRGREQDVWQAPAGKSKSGAA
ncbi:MAG TPA: nitroreductase/quinone reductase family protein [Actinocrinis sp.]|jgi:deazaflavin-dependent oxidoreductase (nitroreductase family)|uniref:nitroreductase/quinone reductase family protein n=1 Tax=Actinocrinis sp. TaxID=1920516 RepID=UPI002DDD6453|nr:nitroreductase/quinone reductase family protein [Actinocrinis sp.]HEV3171907.1 nitroreductase/quinone reductase family protein [Actinocrinis sp.]